MVFCQPEWTKIMIIRNNVLGLSVWQDDTDEGGNDKGDRGWDKLHK